MCERIFQIHSFEVDSLATALIGISLQMRTTIWRNTGVTWRYHAAVIGTVSERPDARPPSSPIPFMSFLYLNR